MNGFTSSTSADGERGAAHLVPGVIIIWLSTLAVLILARDVAVAILRSDEHPLGAVLLVVVAPWLLAGVIVMALVARLGRRVLSGSRRAATVGLVVLAIMAAFATWSGVTYERRWSMEKNPNLIILDAGNDYEAHVARRGAELVAAGAMAAVGLALLGISRRKPVVRVRMPERRATLHALLLAVASATLISGIDLAGARQADARVDALHDRVDRAVVWAFAGHRALSRPAVSAGRVFVSDLDGVVYGIEAVSGRTLWRMPILGASSTTSPIAQNGTVYAAGCCGVTALDAATGRIAWSYRLGKDVYNVDRRVEGQVAAAAGRIILGTSDGTIVALDGRTGRLSWTRPEVADGFPINIAADGTTTVTAVGDELTALDTTSGAILWRARLPEWTRSEPVVGGDLVFIRSDSSVVHAYRAGDGRLAWRHQMRGVVGGRMAVDDRALYVAGDALIALDRRTGSQLWGTPLRVDAVVDLAVVGGRVFAGGDGLDTIGTDGRPIGCLGINGFSHDAGVAVDGEAVFFATNGRLFRLRAFRESDSLKRSLDAAGIDRSDCPSPRIDRAGLGAASR